MRSCSCVVTLLLMNIFFKIRSVRSGSVWNYSRAITSLRSLQQPGQACLKRRRRSPVERRALLPGALVCLSLVGLFVSTFVPPSLSPGHTKFPAPASFGAPIVSPSLALPNCSLVACLPLWSPASLSQAACGGAEAQEEIDMWRHKKRWT